MSELNRQGTEATVKSSEPHHPIGSFVDVTDGAIHFWQHGTDRECHMPAGSFAKVLLGAVPDLGCGSGRARPSRQG